MTLRRLLSLLAVALLLAPASCASLQGERGGPLPFKVAVIPFDVTVLPSAETGADGADEGNTLATRFEPARVNAAIRDALASQFADAVVLPWPADGAPEEFRNRPKREQDAHWLRACVDAGADLVLECDVKVAGRARYASNEGFWLNLPLFLIGGPFCYLVDDTTYRGESRLVASLHQVLPIAGGRATLGNGQAEVARFDVRFDEVRLDFLDRSDSPLSYAASLLIPPGLLARNNERVSERFADEVGKGLAAGLARDVDESSHAILATEGLADFYLLRGVKAVAVGGEVRVEGEVVIRGADAADMRELAIRCGANRVTGTLEAGRPDPFLSTDREAWLRARFCETVLREAGADRVRIELVQGGREQVARSFTVPVSESASRQ